MLKINEDLVLNFIEDNFIDEDTDKVVTLEMSFTFFNKIYMAYLSVDSMEKERLSYKMVNGPEKLIEAFQEDLESLETEKIVREKVKQFLSDYYSN
jgi:hypothetical protein